MATNVNDLRFVAGGRSLVLTARGAALPPTDPASDLGDHVHGDAELHTAGERRRGREAGGVVDLNAVSDELGPPAETNMQVRDGDLAIDARGGARLDQRLEPVPVSWVTSNHPG